MCLIVFDTEATTLNKKLWQRRMRRLMKEVCTMSEKLIECWLHIETLIHNSRIFYAVARGLLIGSLREEICFLFMMWKIKFDLIFFTHTTYKHSPIHADVSCSLNVFIKVCLINEYTDTSIICNQRHVSGSPLCMHSPEKGRPLPVVFLF